MAHRRLGIFGAALFVTTSLLAPAASAAGLSSGTVSGKDKGGAKKPAATAPALEGSPSRPAASAPPPSTAGAGTAAPAPAAAPVDEPKPADSANLKDARSADEEYDLRMHELEDMVGELKEQIFRSKAKLTLLTEQVAGGGGTGAAIVIVHKNEMGSSFLLTEAHYFLDGQPLWNEVDPTGKKLLTKKEYPVWDGNIVEGSHTLTVNLVYRGNGTGVFSYLSGYNFKLKDSITFTAEPGKVVTLSSVGYEKGSFTTEMTDRPAIRFDNESSSETRAPNASPSAEAKP